MTKPAKRTRPPVERVEDVDAILQAMTAAVREAVWRHKRLGTPVAIWREGRVVWLSADEIPLEFEHQEKRQPRPTR